MAKRSFKKNKKKSVKNYDFSPAIQIHDLQDLKDVFTPFFPKGMVIIIWFILFVAAWVFIFKISK